MAPNLDVEWIHGTKSGRPGDEPLLQVHQVDERTFILRQSKNVSYEAPFLHLLIGDRSALLLDTGAVGPVELNPIRATVDQLLAAHPGRRLIVAHTHSHGDHVAGDHQFSNRPDTTVVGRELEAVQQFFGFTDWPNDVVTLDLGGRELEVLAIPGHHRTHIAVYDPQTGFLLTGDTVYPGRLYAFDYPEFMRSVDRLAAFAEDRDVSQLVGSHIEMTTVPGKDYPLGARYQPDEPPLQLEPAALQRLRQRSLALAGKIGKHTFDELIIYNSPGKVMMIREMLRGRLYRIGSRSSPPRNGSASGS
ncbi:MBL fold metallo-hydrolase [Nakamurella lactea]|uniref:MBL fold metallo-hydrolase n=1 Tax=Nakamurella lactea TaxID=459515 RepID=UPI00040A4C4D|nr:MBL fold metallo-hydrolase [Nakamurella lactea]